MAKPIDQAYGEVDFCADIYDYYADHARSILADQPITLAEGSEGSAFVRSRPSACSSDHAVELPAYQIARFAGPNLVIGNTVLLKHAPQCPESALAIEAVFHDAGFPEGAYTNVFATNDQVADVIADPRVQGVSLTGSARAGAAVAEIAGRNLTKVVLELAGRIRSSCSPRRPRRRGRVPPSATRLEGNGQVCNAAKRFHVADHLYDDFLAKFTAAMSAVEPTDPAVDGAELGPAVLAGRSRPARGAAGRGEGAGCHGRHRGRAPRQRVHADRADGVTPDNDAYREEFFGPSPPVHRVADEDAAIQLANDTPFGLGSYLFTTDDPDQALRSPTGSRPAWST